MGGKDPTKVDRSAAYACRQMAKSVVKSGLCKRALVQLSYAIGVAKPLSLFVETYGTEQGKLTTEDITNIVKIEFDARPGALAVSLLSRPATTLRNGWIECVYFRSMFRPVALSVESSHLGSFHGLFVIFSHIITTIWLCTFRSCPD